MVWRRGGDSNPRDGVNPPNGFRDRRFQPDSATSPYGLLSHFLEESESLLYIFLGEAITTPIYQSHRSVLATPSTHSGGTILISSEPTIATPSYVSAVRKA